MTRSLIIAIILFVGFLGFNKEVNAQNACDWEEMKKDVKKDLKPYRYYAFKVTNFSYGRTRKLKEVEVPLFADGDYRFVFMVDGLPLPVDVEIYDKPAKNPSRNRLFSENTENGQFVFETQNKGDMNRIYINYIIPQSPNAEENMSGCILFYSGTKGSF